MSMHKTSFIFVTLIAGSYCPEPHMKHFFLLFKHSNDSNGFGVTPQRSSKTLGTVVFLSFSLREINYLSTES